MQSNTRMTRSVELMPYVPYLKLGSAFRTECAARPVQSQAENGRKPGPAARRPLADWANGWYGGGVSVTGRRGVRSPGRRRVR